MILYCCSTETEFLSLVVLNIISVQKFAGIFMKGLFRPWGGGGNPSTDICSTFKWRYFKCHLLWTWSSKQPDSTFSRAHSQLFRKTLRKAWFLFSFYLRLLNILQIFKTTQYTLVPIWEQTFKKDLCPRTSLCVGSAWKPFPGCWCWRGQILLSRCNLQSWAVGRRCSFRAHTTLTITQSESGQPFWLLWCYKVYYTNSY